MVHQSGGRIQRRSLDPLNAVLRRTGFDRRIPQDPRRLCRAFLCRRVESEDDGVTGLGADEGFKHGSGGGVGHRSNAGYYTHRLGHFHISFHLVFVDHADGFLLFNAVPDIFGRENVFDNLIFHYAAASFFVGHFRQQHMLVQTGQRHSVNDFVHLLLIQFHVFL